MVEPLEWFADDDALPTADHFSHNGHASLDVFRIQSLLESLAILVGELGNWCGGLHLEPGCGVVHGVVGERASSILSELGDASSY